MDTRLLGRQGLATSALGHGAVDVGLGREPHDDLPAVAAVHQAYDTGVTHFDTAAHHGWGIGERVLCAAVAPFRDEITIATRFGFTPWSQPDSRPDAIREQVDNSLRNLDTDRIDLLYQHVHDPRVPIEDVVGVMTELVAAGKVGHLGLSNASAENVRRAHAVHPISVVQLSYSVLCRQAEAVMLVLEELAIGMVASSPLAHGFLTDRVRPSRHHPADNLRQHDRWWAPGDGEADPALVDQLRTHAHSKGATLAQLALAWLLASKPYVVPIPSSRNFAHVAQNSAAAAITLTTEDLQIIDAIAPHGVHG